MKDSSNRKAHADPPNKLFFDKKRKRKNVE
jgi:hypothetical protein